MKSVIKIVFISILITSCSKTALENEFSCKSESFIGNNEKVIDIKKKFTILIPKHWNTNLFFDDIQSSIYFADTTKQLTETVLLDITHLQNEYNFTAEFKKQLFKNDSILQLKLVDEKEITFKEKPSYYRISRGFKGNYPYQIVNIYIKQNNNNAFHIKTEVFGDSLINKRLCKAFQLINTLELK
jgi:hypothetical protein